MKRLKDIINEALVSNATKLTTSDLNKIASQDYTDTSFLNSKFIKWDDKREVAVYGVIGYDDSEGEYIVSYVSVTAYTGGKIKLEIDGSPQGEFGDEKEANLFLRKLK